MEFTKNLINTFPLSVYNNNILEFNPTNSEKDIDNCLISVDGYDFALTPNVDRTFRYNVKNIAKVITNKNNFNDEISSVIEEELNKHDTTLYHEIDLNIKIYFKDSTYEEEVVSLKFIKSVNQVIKQKDLSDSRLFPLLKKHSLNYSLTYFEGYPYDIPVFSDANRNITILNKGNHQSITINLLKGVNRIFLSDGISNTSLLNLFPIHLGYNELEFLIDDEVLFTILLKKVDSRCGIYLKWFNQSGAFSYWMFPDKTRDKISAKDISKINKDTDDINDSNSNYSTTGKVGNIRKSFITQLLNEEERKYVEDIYFSPKVYFLTKNVFSQANDNDWSEIELIKADVNIPVRQSRVRLPISVKLFNPYTQTL